MFSDDVVIRAARREDVVNIVRLLADDSLGAQRECVETPLRRTYYDAFDAIAADANNELIVAEIGGAVVGTLQLTLIPYLTYQGGRRALIEGVRVASRQRGAGVGTRLLRWAIGRAREHGCHMIELTTDKRRADARRFYERLGFQTTHEGMKLHLR
jgi:GNAT superfamily N-acetyltransferase